VLVVVGRLVDCLQDLPSQFPAIKPLPGLINLVITAAWRTNWPWKERQFLREDILECPMAREQPIPHEDRLFPAATHVPLRSPVVIGLFLLGNDKHRHQQRERDQYGEQALHRILLHSHTFSER
jgi:GAF domain-containing protein